jgi:hypothetical protein
MMLDMIETKLYVPPPAKKRKPFSRYRLNLTFSSKAFDFIHLPAILRSNSCKSLLPSSVVDEDIPSIVYSLSKTIRSKIFNYTKFVSSLDLDQAVTDINTVPCACSVFDPRYRDNDHGHIDTGDLSIIGNVELRKLISKGPKYREPATVDFELAIRDITEALDSYIDTICLTKDLLKASFTSWKAKVIDEIRSNIDNINNFVPRTATSVLHKSPVINDLNYLHSIFVFCPIDKAASNVAIVCQRHYTSTIINELNLHNNPLVPNTYERVTNLSEDDIVDLHKSFQQQFNLKLPSDMERLPPLHWTPKMHKTPVGSRFIIGSKKSSLKPLGKCITKMFKVLFHLKSRYYRKTGFFSGVKQFWCIDSHKDVVDTLNKLNDKKEAKTISTYDFSTLYTNIPHNKLIEVLSEIVLTSFNTDTRKFLSVGKKRAYWVKGFSASRFHFSAEDIIACMEFLIGNAYFRVGNSIFRQKIGIPMGSDPAPFFANLFLHSYESKWIKSISRNNLQLARSFNYIFRYIDDLNALNDNNQFARYHKDIYPPELVLKKENPSHNKTATFLDLNITIINKQFECKLYDKRDAFPFYIVRFPYKSSNMPLRMFYSTIGAEILRICRASSQYNFFINACQPLVIRMRTQGSKDDKLLQSINKIIHKHRVDFDKFHYSTNQLAHQITNI